jgi:hypothetical protein
MKDFTYLEHPQNVAVALDVCVEAGVDKKIALEGMKKVKPDLGALVVQKLISEMDLFYLSILWQPMILFPPCRSGILWNGAILWKVKRVFISIHVRIGEAARDNYSN